MRWGAMRLAVVTSLWCGVLVGCADTAGGDTTVFRDAELTFRLLATAIETADTAAILDIFRPDATYEDFANQTAYQGAEEIVGYLTGAHVWGDDVYFNVGRVHATASGAVGEWVFSALHTRPLGDRIPEGTGREVVLNGVTVLEMEGGLIARAADYTDTGAMLLQLGGRIELPGGVVLELESPEGN